MAYPASATTFASRSAGQTIASAHMNAVQTEIAEMEAALLTTGLAHHLFPSGTRTLGTSSAFWDKVFGTALIVGAETTSGVRLDIETGTLAVREGDDSAYAPLSALTVLATTALLVGSADTNGVRLDLSSGNLEVREGDDSAYAQINVLTVLASTAVIVGSADTSGIRLDLNSGTLEIREGDDSTYGPLKALTLEATTSLTVAGGTITNSSGLVVNGGANLTLSSSGDVISPTINANTNAGAANVFIDSGNGKIYRSTSSARYKTNIVPMAAEAWRWLLELEPVTFNDAHRPTGRTFGGLLAEDVAARSPKGRDGSPLYAGLDPDGRPEDVAYTHLTAPIIQAIQALAAKVDRLERAA